LFCHYLCKLLTLFFLYSWFFQNLYEGEEEKKVEISPTEKEVEPVQSAKAPVTTISSESSLESQSVKETVVTSSSSETRVSETETISKAAISEIVVTVPQEIVWKEEDEVVETRIEKKILISHDDDSDHDQALAEAIRKATEINPDLTVEKIEIRMEDTTEES
jgi:hypothetical protein